jgi:hypothetical protein
MNEQMQQFVIKTNDKNSYEVNVTWNDLQFWVILIDGFRILSEKIILN